MRIYSIYFSLAAMWVRKSQSEIVKGDRKKRRQRLNPFGTLVLTLALLFINWLGFRGTLSRYDLSSPVPWFVALLMFALLYFSRLIFGEYRLTRPSLVSAPPAPT